MLLYFVVIQCKRPYGNESDPQKKCSHWFYQCDSNYIGQRTLCQGNLYYDRVQMKCDSYDNVAECTNVIQGPSGTTIISNAVAFHKLDKVENNARMADDGFDNNEWGFKFDDGFKAQDDFANFENASLRTDAGIDIHDHATSRPRSKFSIIN